MTYLDIRKQECEWCAKGILMSSANSSGSKQYHCTPVREDRFTRPCTAPSQDAVIERLTAEVSALQDTDSKRQDECYASGYRDAEAKYTAELATAKEKLRIARGKLLSIRDGYSGLPWSGGACRDLASHALRLIDAPSDPQPKGKSGDNARDSSPAF